MKKYTIKITNLPDVNSYRNLDKSIVEYGRFGYTDTNNFFVSAIHSSHPRNTKIGGYFAITENNELLLSPRGVFYGFEDFISNIIKNGDIKKLLR